MYKLNRNKKIQAKFKLGNGQIITVNLDAMKVMREFGPKHEALAKAEKEAVAAVNAKKIDADEIFEAYGNAIFAVMDLFFGEKQRKDIVEYYENNYVEMTQFVLPYITDKLMPQVMKVLKQQRDALTQKYSGR
jgi:hypothetical protein